MVLKESREDHEVLECFFLPRGLGSRRDFAGKKRGEDSCWWAMRRCHMSLDYLEIAAATQLMVPGA